MRLKRCRLGLSLAVCWLSTAAACSAAREHAESASAGDGSLRVSGVVGRSVPISELGDGKGALHISIADACRNDQGTAISALARIAIADVDLSDDAATTAFEFTGLSAQRDYYLAAWFDDVENSEQDEDLPATGDLAMFGDLSPRCERIRLEKSAAEGLKLVLDYEMMFTLPGLRGDAGVAESEDASVDPGSVVDDGSRHTVTIHLSRSVEPGKNGDGQGKLYAGLSDACFNATTGAVPVPAVAVVLDTVALIEKGKPVDIVVTDVPNGIYQFNGFIDDAAGANNNDPRPGIDDLVSFGGLGPACKQVVVNGQDVGADFVLNLVMPFDL